MLRKRVLRSGYSTGACAAAAAKAAAMLLLDAGARKRRSARTIEIPFPDGSRVKFKAYGSGLDSQGHSAWASVIKDAGDDPDVTNGAEIVAHVKVSPDLVIRGGRGVGVVTKPGLPVAVGDAAINPVPRAMIKEAVMEAIKESENSSLSFEVIISVPRGEELAKKTLNPRLGIVGGISILGTTGIVRPVSADAWMATISASMDVAKAMGHEEIVISAGRVSEKAHIRKYRLPEESYVMMGDYLEFSFLEAEKRRFRKVHLCAQWAKMLKIAMATPHTHVRHGAIDITKATALLRSLGAELPQKPEFNTAREIFDLLLKNSGSAASIFRKVCSAAQSYVGRITPEVPVTVHLVSYEGDILAAGE